MILSDIDIRKYIGGETALIKPFCEDRLQGASYDLSMSNKITAFKKQVRTIDLSEQSAINSAYEHIKLTNEGYALNPGEYILVSVEEELTIPVNMVAHIRPRTRFSRLGIVLSAQHCNPGYSGVLQLGLYNASPNTIILKPGIRISQVVFEELKTVPSPEKQYQNKTDAAYMGEHEFIGAVFDNGELSPEAQKLLAKLKKNVGDL